MNEFKTKLEIETLKALTYTQINELLNKLTLENKKLKEQLILSGVGNRREQLKSFADWLQGEVWDNKHDDFSEYVEDYIKTL